MATLKRIDTYDNKTAESLANLFAETFEEEGFFRFLFKTHKPRAKKFQKAMTKLLLKFYVRKNHPVFALEEEGRYVGFAFVKAPKKGICLRNFLEGLLFTPYALVGGFYSVRVFRAKRLLGPMRRKSKIPRRHATLMAIGVAEEARGKGYGKTLLERVRQNAKENGYSGVYLYTADKPNVTMYEKAGYALLEANGKDSVLTIYHMFLSIEA